jgi:hypothetical protein
MKRIWTVFGSFVLASCASFMASRNPAGDPLDFSKLFGELEQVSYKPEQVKEALARNTIESKNDVVTSDDVAIFKGAVLSKLKDMKAPDSVATDFRGPKALYAGYVSLKGETDHILRARIMVGLHALQVFVRSNSEKHPSEDGRSILIHKAIQAREEAIHRYQRELLKESLTIIETVFKKLAE